MEQIKWGISKDLQVDVRYEPNACKGYVIDISLGCPHQCVYCIFSPLELKAYKLYNSSYKGGVLPLKLDNFLAREEFPPGVYLCYSSDPLGNPELSRLTITVLKKLFSHKVSVLFISKGIFTDEVLDAIRLKPELMEIQVGIANFEGRRNKIVEPGAPTYEERLKNLEKLAAIKGLGSLAVRIDPVLPVIDDTAENIGRIIEDVSRFGVKEAIISYLILTKSMVEAWKRNNYLKAAAENLTEQTTTISEQELFSIPIDKKIKKLSEFAEICKSKGVTMAVCGCKDLRLRQMEVEWICNPFQRKNREEYVKETGQPFTTI